MKIIEMFNSIQGEGITQGVNSLFIRLPYCNLSCVDCDSKYAWKDDVKILDIPDEEIFKRIEKSNNVVITGGEPIIQVNIGKVLKIIEKFPYKTIEIETNGINSFVKICSMINGEWQLLTDNHIQFNISPKINFKQIHRNVELSEHQIFNDLATDSNYIVKFLFKNEEDFEMIRKFQKAYMIPNYRIWIQPIGIDENDIKNTITLYFKQIVENGWNISSRLHVLLFGNKRGI